MNRPDRSMSEPIIYVAAQMERIANQYVFHPMGLSSTSVKILGILKRYGTLTPSGILRHAGGTKSNISQRMDYLEKEGMIARIYGNAQDRRQVSVRLTKKGEKKLLEARKNLKRAHLELEKHFSKTELDIFFSIFDKLAELMQIEQEELEKIFNK